MSVAVGGSHCKAARQFGRQRGCLPAECHGHGSRVPEVHPPLWTQRGTAQYLPMLNHLHFLGIHPCNDTSSTVWPQYPDHSILAGDRTWPPRAFWTLPQVLILFAALSTCDPGNVLDAVKAAKQNSIRVSIVGVAAEVHICKVFTKVGHVRPPAR